MRAAGGAGARRVPNVRARSNVIGALTSEQSVGGPFFQRIGNHLRLVGNG